MDVQRQDRFFERAEDFGEVGGGRGKGGISGRSGNHLEKEFVTGAAGKACIFAAGGDDAGGNRAASTPLEVDVLEKEVVRGGGQGRVGWSNERAAGFSGGVRVDDELEMAADESGVGVGVVGYLDGGDEDSAGLLGFE